jgi:hypothetical protein
MVVYIEEAGACPLPDCKFSSIQVFGRLSFLEHSVSEIGLYTLDILGLQRSRIP